MHKVIQYSFIFLLLAIVVPAAMGDAFDQTVVQIKTLEAELEQNQIDIEAKQTFIEAELATEFADHALKAPKGEFESDADYQARQRQLTGIIAERRTELEEEHLSLLRVRRLEIQTELGRSRRTVFFTHDFTAPLGAYDANTETFPIEFEVYDQSISRSLYVDKNDAPGLKNNWDQVVKTAYISIDPGYRRALVELKLEYPLLWEHGVTWNFDVVYYLGNNNSIAFSPDGKYLAAGSSNEQGIATERGIATIWKMEDGEKFRRLDHGDWVYAVAFSPNGKYFATGGEDELRYSYEGKVVLWDMKSGAKVRSLNHNNEVESVVFSPNRNYLATGSLRYSYEGRVILWDVDSGRNVWHRTYRANTRTINALTFTPNGSYLATGNVRRYSYEVDNATLWQVNNGNAVSHFEHQNGVYDVAFSPDAEYLATGNDGSVTFWEVSSARRIRHVEMPDRRAAVVTFSPDGKFLAVLAVRKIKEKNYCYINFFRVGTEDITFETVIPRVKSLFVGNKVRGLAWHPSGNFISDGERVYRTLLEPIITDMVAKPLETRRDVNRDGVVDVDDLVLVASNFGKSFEADANPNPDVNLDGIVDRADIIEIIISLESAPGAPSANSPTIPTLTIESLQRWIESAKQRDNKDETFQKGIRVLEQLLTTLRQAEIIPEATILLSNYPNPFNPETWIPYQLAAPADVTLTIYAIDGRVVRTLALGHQPIGIYQDKSQAVYWDGKNNLGEPVASGLYFYTLTAGDFTATRKMLIAK